VQYDDSKYQGQVSFIVDGHLIARAPAKNGAAMVAGPQASALAIAAAHGTLMEIKAGNRMLGKPSLAGSSAALRAMDARQGRAGTVTALIATGSTMASAMKPAPVLPIVRRVVEPASAKAQALWTNERASVDTLTGCADEVDIARNIEVYPLPGGRTLALMPCGSGAYNLISVPVIGTGNAGRRSFALAKFDYAPGWGGEGGPPMLVNAGWSGGRLSSFAKGRGIGDCGNSEDYVWDGAQFRLVEASAMGECRGASDWITVWRAKVTP